MEIKKIGKIRDGQDGAIWGDELFRFNHKGECRVFKLSQLDGGAEELLPSAEFVLDRADEIVPHSNAVFFGTEYYEEGDEFPLLYSNIYNNYADAEDKLIGVCCVYRLLRDGESFSTALVQLIQIGFCDDPTLWRAYADRDCVRPFGNFLIDRDAGYYYAFVMRTEEAGTRYFKFDIPKVAEGEIDPRFGVRRVVLGRERLVDYFDVPHHYFIQGGTIHKGLLYSTEGFDYNEANRPAIRVSDLAAKKQVGHLDLMSVGYFEEPELIDFYNGACLYSDAHGTLYKLER